MLRTLAVANYRSLREVIIGLGALNLVTGANGSGKSNLYRALRLVADTAQGRATESLSREGGLSSVCFAGPEDRSGRMRRGEVAVQGGPRQEAVSLKLGFATDDLSYAIDFGFPAPGRTAFSLDPEIKREVIWSGVTLRPSTTVLDRRGPGVKLRSGDELNLASENVAPYDSVFTQFADPRRAPEVLLLREYVRGWRFYDHFRTDRDSPARQSNIGTRTPALGHEGSDLAAAWQTIVEVGDGDALAQSVNDAFPGASVEIESHAGLFSLLFKQQGLLRPLGVAELSDGTLRYLLLIAALHTARPPPLMVLNEPETSLHPDLLEPLARLIIRGSAHSQVWVVSHAPALIEALEQHRDCTLIRLAKQMSQTVVDGDSVLSRPTWRWPTR